jgi:hypothetical protein
MVGNGGVHFEASVCGWLSAQAAAEIVGARLSRDSSRATSAPLAASCQFFDMFVAIATAAGPDLTTESFAAAAEALGPIEITGVSEASSGPDKFDLSDSVGVITRFDPEAVQFQPVG